jgi:hypothetical protein
MDDFRVHYWLELVYQFWIYLKKLDVFLQPEICFSPAEPKFATQILLDEKQNYAWLKAQIFSHKFKTSLLISNKQQSLKSP